MMTLKDYQKNAVYNEQDGLLPVSLRQFDSDADGQRLIIMKAITGSGKTIIAAEYIRALFGAEDERRESESTYDAKDICVIWLSKGNGDLHMQSGNKLKEYLKGNPDIHIYPIESSSDFHADSFRHKDVYVINWEKLNRLDANGDFNSNLLARSERNNFLSAFNHSQKSARKVKFVFIIDEFHQNYGTAAYNKIIGLFKPTVIIGMTATPTQRQLDIEGCSRDFIKVSDVINAQMIKKGVCFNTANDSDIKSAVNSGYDTISEYFLQLSIAKRDALERAYKASGSSVIPLLLIQFDNDSGNKELLEIKNILDQKYENNKHNTYAIWISDSIGKIRSSDEIIETLDSNHVRILLFKQAIATGWDCPRAQVLLKYRRANTAKDINKASIFDIQTIGRILRMPERKFYANENLNYAYIYVPSRSCELENAIKESYTGPEGEIFNGEGVDINLDPQTSDQEAIEPQDTAETATSHKGESKPSISNGYSVPENGQKSSLEQSGRNSQQQDDSSVPIDYGQAIVGRTNKSAEISEDVKNGMRRLQEILCGQNKIAINHCPCTADVKAEIDRLIDKLNIDADISKYEQEKFNSYKMGSEHLQDKKYTGGTTAALYVDESVNILNDKVDRELKLILNFNGFVDTAKDVNRLEEHARSKISKKFSSIINGGVSGAGLDIMQMQKRDKLILTHLDVIRRLRSDLSRFVSSNSSYTFENSNFVFPKTAFYSSTASADCKECTHHPLSERASEPEHIFERFLNNNDNVLFWFKNFDSGSKAFCVPYDNENVNRGRTYAVQSPTYPDFLVGFKNGEIGFYEIKDYDKVEYINDKKKDGIEKRVREINSTKETPVCHGTLFRVRKDTCQIIDINSYPEFGVNE